jgi:2-methylisocitrate lyase-like PEP mutase family enzyme
MNPAEQAQQAELFRVKHHGQRLLLLPNAWDAMSARVFVAGGFDAIATTSGSVAWSLGYPEGKRRRGTRWSPRRPASCRLRGFR